MYTHIIDRSDLDEVVCIGTSGTKYTRLADLRRFPAVHHRRDVVLLNATRSKREYILQVTPTWFSGDLWILDILTPEQYAEVLGIGERMRQNALDHPECRQLLDLTAEAEELSVQLASTRMALKHRKSLARL